jgi:hypothetical protein
MGVKFNPFTGNLDLIDTTAAAGADTQVQYNNGGSLAGSADLTWDDSGKELGVGGDINLDDGGTYETTVQVVTPTANRTISFPDATGTVALVAGSSGQVTYNNAGALAGFNGLTIDGSGNLSGGGVGTTSPAVAWDVVGQVRASTGILFGTDTAAANALDDYEEGTHTTTATCTSGTVTLSEATLAYTKIGKLVVVHGRPLVNTISSPTGNLTLSLPFATADLTDSAGRSAGSIRLRLVAGGYDVGLFSCSVDESSSSLSIVYGGSTDSVAAAPAMAAGTQIWFSITYRTA